MLWLLLLFFAFLIPILVVAAQNQTPLSVVFGHDDRYACLCHIHKRTLYLRRNNIGASVSDLISQVCKYDFRVFFLDPGSPKNSIYISFIEKVLSDPVLVEKYLWQPVFKLREYRKLVEEVSSSGYAAYERKAQRLFLEMIPDKVRREQGLKYVEKYIPIFAELHTPPFMGMIKNRGENEYCNLIAAEEAGIIKPSLGLEQFVECMMAIAEIKIYNQMSIVKSAQALRHHQDNLTIDNEEISLRKNALLKLKP